MSISRHIKCDFLEWEFKCPKLWQELEESTSPDVRFCNGCKSNVYFSNNNAQLIKWANEGKCTAFEYDNGSEKGILTGSLNVHMTTENEKKVWHS
ncbi:hypothetical protein [Marinicellulosiphila megalodicopiae]|uniref:hypothetical protein n=1 Tax=Marinicellulosiphila megalodicopiae TaxID=2724896 RepID=UPI003BAFEB56